MTKIVANQLSVGSVIQWLGEGRTDDHGVVIDADPGRLLIYWFVDDDYYHYTDPDYLTKNDFELVLL